MPRRLPKYLLLALIAYWVAMFVATHIPGEAMPRQVLGIDKLVHFAAYAVLAWLAALALWRLGWAKWKAFAAIMIVGAIYAAFDEWLQPYFHREADVDDWIADMLGVAFGLIAFHFTEHLWRRRGDREETTSPRPPAAS